MYAEVDAVAVGESTGAFVQSGERTFLQATGFVVNPEGKISTAVYATGPIGRLTPTEVLRMVLFVRNQ